MPRPKKTVVYHANSETVRKFFKRSMEERETQKDASLLISSLNTAMSHAGVHPGVMSFMRRIAATPEGKRGWLVALTRTYLEWLADELSDPQLDIEDAIAMQKSIDEQAEGNVTAIRRSANTPPAA